MQIRDAKPTDASRLAEIHVRGWQFTYKGIIPNSYLSKLSIEEYTSKWSEKLRTKNPLNFHIVAELDDIHVIGFASVCPERTVVPRQWGELSMIYVLSRYHKQGVGTALFNEVIARLKKQGYKGMISWMLAENPAGAFYRKLGGTQQGVKTELIDGVMKELTAYEWTF
jgi:GNAT superfamily N-acetyltransferase